MVPRAIVLLLILLCILAAGCTSMRPATSSTPTPTPPVPQGTVTVLTTVPSIPVASSTLVVRFLDVGQGDAALLQGPSGKTMLIDAGPTSAGSSIVSTLRGLGVTTLDVVVATHPHEDHIGGMTAVLAAFPVREFIDAGYPHGTETYERMLMLIDEKNIPYSTVDAGDTIAWDPSVSIAVRNPQPGFFDDVNENSIVLRVVHGSTEVLLSGDAGEKAEAAMQRQVLDADILKVGHHGSRTSSGTAFLAAVSPEVSVISVGAGNSYGHPTTEAMQRLEAVHSTIYRTDQAGMVTVTSTGSGYTIATAKTVSTRTATPVPISTQLRTTTRTPAPTTAPVSSGVCSCSSNLYNCGDFTTHAAAQECYAYCMGLGKGDVHRLDGTDQDGDVCEALP